MRSPRFRKQNLAAQLRQEVRELLGIARLVEQVGAEDDVPRSRPEHRLRLAPTDSGHTHEDLVALGVQPDQLDRVLRPIRGEHLCAAQRRRERRQSQPASELEDTPPCQVAIGDVPREGEPARPELGPVRQELLLVERRLVDQLLSARRPQNRQAKAGA